ncbi:regenerating islet-derived protein 4-like [Heterodontus francisci]|uniref:regenerating islet-derived protein 4-like n=1 Tax=Heterodontus francisci TaxID=7792 RepID=UPI00355B9E69
MFLNTASAGRARSMCPEGWFFYASSCYGYFTFQLTWAQAENDCMSYGNGGHLASIHNNREADIIANNLSAFPKEADVWIGGHDPQENRRWKWTDGSMFNYKSWASFEPNNVDNQEYCMELEQRYGFQRWNDVPCNTKNYYICKYKS